MDEITIKDLNCHAGEVLRGDFKEKLTNVQFVVFLIV